MKRRSTCPTSAAAVDLHGGVELAGNSWINKRVFPRLSVSEIEGFPLVISRERSGDKRSGKPAVALEDTLRTFSNVRVGT